MTLFKICGITCVEDALLSAELGAYAIGLNFWPRSKRYVTVEEAEPIVAAVRARARATRIVGVFVDASFETIVAVRDQLGLDFVQLHGDEPEELVERLGPTAFKAIRLDGRSALERARRYGGPHVLLDAAVAGSPGGTGVCADWALAAEIARERPVWLAGGITPDNAADAVAAVQPVLLDVASGVERPDEPRRKAPALLRRLLTVPA